MSALLPWAAFFVVVAVFAILLCGAFCDPDDLQRKRALEDAARRKAERQA